LQTSLLQVARSLTAHPGSAPLERVVSSFPFPSEPCLPATADHAEMGSLEFGKTDISIFVASCTIVKKSIADNVEYYFCSFGERDRPRTSVQSGACDLSSTEPGVGDDQRRRPYPINHRHAHTPRRIRLWCLLRIANVSTF